MGGHFPPLTQLRMDLAQIDTWTQESSAEADDIDLTISPVDTAIGSEQARTAAALHPAKVASATMTGTIDQNT